MVQKYLSPSYNISWCISARNILFQKYILLFQIILRFGFEIDCMNSITYISFNLRSLVFSQNVKFERFIII